MSSSQQRQLFIQLAFSDFPANEQSLILQELLKQFEHRTGVKYVLSTLQSEPTAPTSAPHFVIELLTLARKLPNFVSAAFSENPDGTLALELRLGPRTAR
jgi:hypothetical protein